jgi:hypothetical protein
MVNHNVRKWSKVRSCDLWQCEHDHRITALPIVKRIDLFFKVILVVIYQTNLYLASKCSSISELLRNQFAKWLLNIL